MHFHSQWQCRGRQQLSECAKKLGWIGKVKEMCFRWRRNVIMVSAGFIVSGSVFHKVGAATEKARVPAFVFTLGTASTIELDDRSCLCCRERREQIRRLFRWKSSVGDCAIVNPMRNRTGSQCSIDMSGSYRKESNYSSQVCY